jgi:hypothetical protein
VRRRARCNSHLFGELLRDQLSASAGDEKRSDVSLSEGDAAAERESLRGVGNQKR